MQIFRGFQSAGLAPAVALTIGNFDGMHLGHRAVLARLAADAAARGLPSCVLSFEPHPRDFFAAQQNNPNLAPARICLLRDKLTALAAAGVEQTVLLRFNAALAALSAEDFVRRILLEGLGARHVLVGDDFRFGHKRSGDFALLQTLAAAHGFTVGSMDSLLTDAQQRVSSTMVRQALAQGDMVHAQALLGQAYSVSGHVVHGRKLGRSFGVPTLNLRFAHWKPAVAGIFVVQVHGLSAAPLRGVANFGVRPSLDPNDINGGRVLLETFCLDWPAELGSDGAYGKIIRVALLHKLHDEIQYTAMDELRAGIAQDIELARRFFAGLP